jgi:acyl-CoA thioester hydrolase
VQVHVHELTVPPEAIDANGHANNVEFVRWMQEAAVSHADVTGLTAATLAAGAAWVVRSHRIEYLRPALAGERLAVRTWVVNLRRARSLRKYEIVRGGDGVTLATGETEWVFVDAQTGRPRSVPGEFTLLLNVRGEQAEA